MKTRSLWSRLISWSSIDARLLKRILAVGLGAFLLGFGMAAAAMWIGSSRQTVVTVPDLRAMETVEARRAVRDLELELEVGDSLPNPEVAHGAVLAQSPQPGREVAPGSTVRIILSTGPERRAVPQVGQLGRDQAVKLLEASGFKVELREVADERAPGRVVGTQPAAGTVVPVPAAVQLLVSKGPPRVAVPALVGLLESDAAGLLSAHSLRVGEVRRQYRPDRPLGEILTQNPAPGDSATAGSAVGLVVATHELLGVPVGEDP